VLMREHKGDQRAQTKPHLPDPGGIACLRAHERGAKRIHT
jgi:hypothetical protein